MKFILSEQLACEFLTEFVATLNEFYKNKTITGFYNRCFGNFSFCSGNRFENFDYFNDEYLPNKYLFFSLTYNVKFLNAPIDDQPQDLAILLPKNATDFLNLKIDKLENLPDAKRHFLRFMYKVFGEEYKQKIKRYLKSQEQKQQAIMQENQRFLQEKINYNNSFLEEF